MTPQTLNIVKALIKQEYYQAEKYGEWWKIPELEQAIEELQIEI